MSTDIALFHGGHIPVEVIIHEWLSAQKGSQRTKTAYEATITSFRTFLQTYPDLLTGLPLDLESDIRQVSTAAEKWASQTHRAHVHAVARATYNHRLAVLSSFYHFARKRQLLLIDNPIDLLERQDVQAYKKAHPLPQHDVMRVLESIDLASLSGKRDYALLLLLFMTGRRASEVLTLEWQHVQFDGTQVTIYFEHCKGDEEMKDILEPECTEALTNYLSHASQAGVFQYEIGRRLWVSLSPVDRFYGKPLSLRGLAAIFERHFASTKIHATRHTFTKGMLESGASVYTIQQRLGHKSLTTTSQYTESLGSAKNPFARDLLHYYGIQKKQEH